MPTPALRRSLVLAALIGLVAIVTGRADVVVFMVPFVVHLCWALLARPTSRPAVTVSPQTVVVPEGESVEIRVSLDGSAGLTAVQWPIPPGAVLDPPTGAVLEAGGVVSLAAEPRRWGRYNVGPGVVSTTDISGGWRASTTIPRKVTVTVRPSSTTLEGGSGVSHPIGLVGAHRSLSRGDGTELADVREFRPGDRLRRINWRVTSRLGSLHVNQTLMERDTDVLIVVDTLQDVASADPDAATSLDVAVRAIAAISRHYTTFGDRVRIHDLGHRIGPVRAGSGPRQARIVLNVLSRARRDVADWARPRPVGSLAAGTLIFFCSPLLDKAAQDELVRLRRLGGEVIGVDTLPDGVGTFREVDSFRKESFLGEAWLIRRIERDDVVARLQTIGIPVVPWRGTGSLASVLLAMEAARSAPRAARR